MKGRHAIVLLCLATSCARQEPGGIGLLSEPSTQVPVGPFVHEPSGITFPETVAPFQREEVTIFDVKGDNIAAMYSSQVPSLPIKATAYVYPLTHIFVNEPANPLRQHMDQLVESVQRQHPNAQAVSTGPSTLPLGNRMLPSQKVVLRYSEMSKAGNTPLLSEVHLAMEGRWFLKWRVTYMERDTNGCSAAVTRLLSSLTTEKRP